MMIIHTDFSGPFALRTLGTTGLQVTPLSVGCAPLGNMPETFAYEVAEDQALRTIRAIFTGPINFLDTAASYGESERRLGMVIHELGGPPPGFVLVPKADRDLHTGEFTVCFGDQHKTRRQPSQFVDDHAQASFTFAIRGCRIEEVEGAGKYSANRPQGLVFGDFVGKGLRHVAKGRAADTEWGHLQTGCA